MEIQLTELFPPALLQTYAFLLGVIIGSFLNVYIYRFHTGKSLSGKSHCLSCGTPLTPIELVPLFSYLGLRGKCRTCGCRIPIRYFLVELLTGVLFLWAVLFTQNLLFLLVLWFLLALLIIITVYDIYHFIIPDALTITVTFGVVAWYGLKWLKGGYALETLGVDVMVALAGAGFLYILWYVSKGTWIGFGDVKLAIPLGWWVGASSVFSFIVLSFWIGAAVSLVILGYQRWQGRGQDHLAKGGQGLTMKSAVPFAPFLVASCVFIIFTSFNVLSLFQTF